MESTLLGSVSDEAIHMAAQFTDFVTLCIMFNICSHMFVRDIDTVYSGGSVG